METSQIEVRITTKLLDGSEEWNGQNKAFGDFCCFFVTEKLQPILGSGVKLNVKQRDGMRNKITIWGVGSNMVQNEKITKAQRVVFDDGDEWLENAWDIFCSQTT